MSDASECVVLSFVMASTYIYIYIYIICVRSKLCLYNPPTPIPKLGTLQKLYVLCKYVACVATMLGKFACWLPRQIARLSIMGYFRLPRESYLK